MRVSRQWNCGVAIVADSIFNFATRSVSKFGRRKRVDDAALCAPLKHAPSLYSASRELWKQGRVRPVPDIFSADRQRLVAVSGAVRIRPKTLGWLVSFRAASCILLLCAPWSTTATARGGHFHGIGRGIDQGGRIAFGPRTVVATYVLIAIFKVTDADAFKAAVRDFLGPQTTFVGRIAVNADKPESWEGKAAEHVLLLQFNTPDEAQGWKSSEAFQKFGAELHRSSEFTIQLLPGLPLAATGAIGGRRRGRGFDQRAFEPNVKEYDHMLNKMHGICKGC